MPSYVVEPEANPTDRGANADERRLVEALRVGDEAAFAALVARYHRTLLNLALLYVADRHAAEDVVQETWLGVLQGIGRFEGRSSLKTWLCRIAANRARTRGVRESRSAPFSAVWTADDEGEESAVDPERFIQDGSLVGHWSARPESWAPIPEASLVSAETRARIQTAIDALPANQRLVITMRDVDGWDADEVCRALGLTAVHQRVLLHRARSKVRAALEAYLGRGAHR